MAERIYRFKHETYSAPDYYNIEQVREYLMGIFPDIANATAKTLKDGSVCFEIQEKDMTRDQKPVIIKDSTKVTRKGENQIQKLLSEIMEPITAGAKMAGSAEAAELLVRTFYRVLRKRQPTWASVLERFGGDFQHLQTLVLATAVKMAVSAWPNLPQAKTAKKIADLAMQFESAMFLKPLLGHVTEFVEALVSGGTHLVPKD